MQFDARRATTSGATNHTTHRVGPMPGQRKGVQSAEEASGGRATVFVLSSEARSNVGKLKRTKNWGWFLAVGERATEP